MLTYELKKAPGVPIYEALYRCIRADILSGKLAAGEKLPSKRALAAHLAAAQRELKSWGVIFTDGGRRRLVTAEEAKQLRRLGRRPEPGAVLTPLAKEILGGAE